MISVNDKIDIWFEILYLHHVGVYTLYPVERIFASCLGISDMYRTGRAGIHRVDNLEAYIHAR